MLFGSLIGLELSVCGPRTSLLDLYCRDQRAVHRNRGSPALAGQNEPVLDPGGIGAAGVATDAHRSSWKGLELAAEPDLESRLLCALAGVSPEGSPERRALIERAVDLKESLVAQASARLMGLR